MAEAKLTIDIDVDGAPKAVAGLASVNKAIKSIDSRHKGLASTANATSQLMTTSTLKLKKHFDQFDKVIKTVGTIGLKGLTMTLKFATIEMVAMGAAMVAIHGAFVLGNAAMKAMRATLGPLAAGMTAVVAAASAAAAAIREQQAAMYAYKNHTAPQFGSGLNQARMVMRGLHSDVELASVGVENLNKAYATVSKTSTFTGKSQVMLKGLMDFASAGQPIEEGIQKAADLIALLQDSKKSFSEAKASAQQLFPDKNTMDKAFKDLKITTKKGLEKAITTGDLARAANVEGQFEAVSGTLINRLKGYFNIIKVQFGDLGQPLLEPVKKAAYQIFNILRRGFVKISGNTQRFGMGSMLEGLVSMVDKLTTWSTNLINENIQSVDGMFSKMAGWWKDFRYGWNETLDKLRPFIEGARVIEKMFGEVWKHVKNVVASGFNQFNEWLIANEATVLEFGGKVGDLITSIMKFQQEMKKILQDLMPFINDIVGGLAQMVDYMTGFVKLLRNLTGGGAIGALASLLAIRGTFSAMKTMKGGWTASQTITTQPINAQQVILNSPSVVAGGGNLGTTGLAMRGGAGGAGGAGGTGGAGLASNAGGPGPTGGMVVLPSGRTPPGGGGGGGFIPSTPSGPSSPLHRPMIGQPGYVPPSGRFQKFRDWEYRNFMMAGKSEEDLMKTRAMRTNKSGNLTFRAKMAQREMALREVRSGDNQSVGYRRLNKFQQSSGARMGTGLALGAMSQFAPEEAQGALALGGAVSMINPLAGIGVAGLGTALKSQTAAGGLISGAGGGAAMGAMIGTMVGPVGAAAGAAIGAVLGGVTGAVMGSINRSRKQVKEAKQAASEVTDSIMNNVLSGVLDATRKETGVGGTALRTALTDTMQKQNRALGVTNKALDLAKTGGVKPISEVRKGQKDAIQQIYDAQAFYGVTMTEEQLQKMLKKPAAALAEMQKDIETGQKAMGPIQEKYNNRMDQLQKITGKSDQEINALAKSMGVNLMDGTKDFMKVLEELGLTAIRTADQMRASVANSYINALKGFDKEIEAIKAPLIIDEAAESLRRLYDAQGGKITEVQNLQYVNDTMEQMLTLYGGDAMKAYTQTQMSFKKGGTAFTDPNSPFFGLENLDLLGNEKVQKVLENFRMDAGLDYGAQLNSRLLDMGGSIDVNKFQAQWKTMTPEQQLKASQVLENGIGTGSAAMRLIEQSGSPAQALLDAAGFGNLKIGKAETADTKEIDLTKASKDIVESTNKIIKQMEIYFTEANEAVPAWYTKESFEKLLGGDTSTPRGHVVGDTTSSRLSQTMARHASMNGMLTGTRTVTSGYRTFGLGSMNSDHVTGRAYDLVGQNLGQYQSLVRATGGFAEFHGINGARHLHVVPGSGAIGDRRVPVMSGSAGSTVQMSAGNGGNNYNFYITGNQNASAKEIADMVMQKVKDTERSNRERK